MQLQHRAWVPAESEQLVQRYAGEIEAASDASVEDRIYQLIAKNRTIHEAECLNLNPATNVMNPRAEAAMAARLGSRPSLGYPGAKYETGLEAIEEIEVIAAELAAGIFGARYAEVRVPSGAVANLYAFMACAQPGDAIIAPPPSIGGHVTHHGEGVAGLYGLAYHPAPVDADRYTIDVDRLQAMADELKPAVITVGASLNLFPHPIAEIRAVADSVGAKVVFDAAHLSGLIAGQAWPNPLDEGAHVMTMSTYKSLGGPPSGLLVTNQADLAERVDAIAYPGLTANFDAGKTAALALALLDWRAHGAAYARAMVDAAAALAEELVALGVPVFAGDRGATASHAFAVDARPVGGGPRAAQLLRGGNLLASAIGLPTDAPSGPAPGLRLGLNEAVRWGLARPHMPELAAYIDRALRTSSGGSGDQTLPAEVSAFRRRFSDLHYLRT